LTARPEPFCILRTAPPVVMEGAGHFKGALTRSWSNLSYNGEINGMTTAIYVDHYMKILHEKYLA
jgi:hypothetical protein